MMARGGKVSRTEEVTLTRARAPSYFNLPLLTERRQGRGKRILVQAMGTGHQLIQQRLQEVRAALQVWLVCEKNRLISINLYYSEPSLSCRTWLPLQQCRFHVFFPRKPSPLV